MKFGLVRDNVQVASQQLVCWSNVEITRLVHHWFLGNLLPVFTVSADWKLVSSHFTMITRRFFLLTCTLSLSSWYHEQQVAEASNDLPSSQPLTWKSSSGEAVKDRAVPQLLVISFDGFRYDYFDLVPIRSLRAFSQRGVHARRGMKPSFPTVTISSHYTIATGLYPESHGIVSNNFYDPVTNTSFSPKSREQHFFDKGEPIWVTAKRQGKRTAVINWFGGQVDWGNESPDIAPPFSNNVSLRDRVDQVIKFLQEDKMDLVMLYYNQPDRAGHTFGSLSNEVFMELEIIDRELDRMFQIMEKRQMTDNVNIIILSDHGMMNLTSEPYILIKVDDWEMEKNTDAIVVSDAIAHFFLKSGGEDREKIVINHLKNLQRSRGHFNVYTKRDIPERWHYRNNPRIGSVIVVADPGYYLIAHRVSIFVNLGSL